MLPLLQFLSARASESSWDSEPAPVYFGTPARLMQLCSVSVCLSLQPHRSPPRNATGSLRGTPGVSLHPGPEVSWVTVGSCTPSCENRSPVGRRKVPQVPALQQGYGMSLHQLDGDPSRRESLRIPQLSERRPPDQLRNRNLSEIRSLPFAALRKACL